MKEKKASVADRIIQGLEEFVEVLERKQPVTEKFTCREVELDLQPTSYSPELVKETRRALNSSQAIFARLLGVSPKTVRSWEQGIHEPKDVACRFMDEIRMNPKYWLKRLQDSTIAK